jgi:hypothetical protein
MRWLVPNGGVCIKGKYYCNLNYYVLLHWSPTHLLPGLLLRGLGEGDVKDRGLPD